MPSYKPVTAAIRVLDVLEAVNRLNNRATIAEIHRRTGIDKATIVRMLETLVFAGYVFRDPDRSIYRITGKALSLSTAFDLHTVVGNAVAPLMAEFRQRIGWPSDVALIDNDAMLVVKSSRQSEPFSMNRPPGFRAPLLGTSLGLAYVAHCRAAERAEILARLPDDGAAWNKLAQDPARLQKRLEDVRRLGYAVMDETYSRVEYEGRIGSIGVPIMTKTRIFASINITYLNTTLSPQAARDTLLAPLQETAAKMAEQLAVACPVYHPVEPLA